MTEPYRKSKIAENLVDAADAITSVPDFSPTGSAPNITGHGGEFGGGGASGAWTEAGGIAETASTVGETATEAAGEAVSGLAKAARSFRKSWAFCPSTNFVNVSAGIRFNFNLYIYGADRIPA